MLTNPKCGWVTVSLGNFTGPASYLTEVAIECLESMIYALENHTDFIVSFDAEGWTFKIIADDYRSFVIVEQNTTELIVCDKDKTSLAKEILEDILRDIEDWNVWSTCDLVHDKNGLMEYQNSLHKLLEELKQLIE